MSIPLTSVTLSNNSATVTVNSPSINLSSVQSGWMIFIDGYAVPLEIASGGQDLLTLADTYTGATLTARIAVVVETKAALTDAIEAINLLGNQLVTAKDDYQVALDAQGTAATHTVTTSTTDTTANRLLKVGDFGVGVSGTNIAPNIGNFDTQKTSGLFRTVGNEISSPFNSGIGAVINMRRGGANGLSQFYLRGDEGSNTVQAYARGGVSGGTFSDWVEFYHSGNTNFNEFGGDAGDVIALAIAVSATEARASFSLNSTIAPSSVSQVGTVSIKGFAGQDTGNNALPNGNMLLSSPKFGLVQWTGLSGLTGGETYRVQLDTSTSKITIDF